MLLNYLQLVERDGVVGAKVVMGRLVRAAGIERVFLVTSAWHMPRAASAARRFGLEPVPAPTGFREGVFAGWRSFVPHWNGLRDTCLALHEWGGRVVYALTP